MAITIAEFAKVFLENHAVLHNKPSEVHSKRQILKSAILPALGAKRLDELRKFDIVAFAAAQRARGLTAKTVNNRLTVLSKLLACALEWDVVDAIPPVQLLKRVAQPEIRWLSPAEERALLEVVGKDEPWRSMIVVGLHTGLRIGELRALQWSAVNLRAPPALRVHLTTWSWTNEIGTPKGHKPRSVPLNSIALQTLKGALRLGDHVFTARPKGGILPYQKCISTMRTLLRDAGIKGAQPWHCLRHTFASRLVQAGVHLKIVQELLGHATLDMTLKYAHLAPDTSAPAVELLVDAKR